MIRLCKDAGLPEPKFEQKAGSFVVTFKKGNRRIVTTAPKSIWKLNNTQKKIIEYLKRHGKAKTSEIQKHMGISLRAIRRNLKEIAVIIYWSGKSPTDPTGKYSLKSLKNFKSLFK
jgi:ATP-dependent DNA helicase RecG